MTLYQTLVLIYNIKRFIYALSPLILKRDENKVPERGLIENLIPLENLQTQ